MEPMYSIGLDVHKQKISYCVKDSSRTVLVYGGEYNTKYSSTSSSVDALEVQLYDPATDEYLN